MKDTNNTEEIISNPLIKKTKSIHIIWLFLIIFLLLAVTFFWSNRNINDITVNLILNHAQGIEPNKTQVIYNGIAVGYVSNIETTDDLQKLSVTLEINKKLKKWLTDKTKFWIVKPNISLSGVTGLETLVTGNYIAIQPDNTGKLSRQFTSVSSVPVDKSIKGLYITLSSNSLHSITINSPIYFREIEVGKVVDYNFDPNTKKVKINLVIYSKYSHLVHKNSRFWNASGIQFDAGFNGFHVKMESVAALLRGGISFYTPPSNIDIDKTNAITNDEFTLYSDFDEAKAGTTINIHFPSNNNTIPNGANIIFNGVKIGKVKDVIMSENLTGFDVKALINPGADQFIVAGTTFWIVSPFSGGLSAANLKTLLNGNYIEMDVSKESIDLAVKQTSFKGYQYRPHSPLNRQGLHLALTSDTTDNITNKSPVLYRGYKIGQVVLTKLSSNGGKVSIKINIFPEYVKLINSSTQFTVNNNFSVKGSLCNLEITTSSLLRLISGSIEVSTPNINAPAINPNKKIPLLTDKQKQAPGLKLLLTSDNLGGVSRGVPILYLGIPVGKVTDYYLDNPASKVLTEIIIYSPYINLVSNNSKFWNDSGLKLNASLFSGIEIKTKKLSNIITGAISFATPSEKGNKPTSYHRFELHNKPNEDWEKWHPSIELKN